jgi:hypothetical protein
VRKIGRARRRLKVGPHGPTLGHPRSTVYAVLRRQGLSRLDHLDRPTSIPVRYERERPRELLHVDVKKLGRIPLGGGHRIHGRGHRPIAAWATTTCTSRSMITPAMPTSRSIPTSEETRAHRSSSRLRRTSPNEASGSNVS